MARCDCMNCGSSKLVEFIDFGPLPNGNNFPVFDKKDDELLFPMSMMVCEDCWQVQIAEFPSQEFLFTNHPYITGVNQPIVNHFKWMSAHIIEKFNIPANSLAIDIGCNDGTLLRAFADNGMRVMGVDPGQRTGQLARSHGTTVCETFWNLDTAKAIKALNLRPRVITATAVFYHLPDLHEFIEGLKLVMEKDTVFAVQCVSMKDVIEKLEFDHFYHEHSCIHAVGPLKRLFDSHGLRVLDVEHIDVHGGSFIMFVGRSEHPWPTSDAVDAAIQAEKDAGLYQLSTYHDFAQKVWRKCADLKALLEQLKSEGKLVYGLGAPVKGSTLLCAAGIGPDLVERVTEVNKFKIGTVTPGTHIPVVSEESLEREPDYYLMLSWNFAEFFLQKYSDFLKRGGKFIIPMPDVRVVGQEGAG